MRHNYLLTFRHGHYREDRDGFLRRRSAGFFTPVIDTDRDLFDCSGHGIVASGIRALSIDLDISESEFCGKLSGAAALDEFLLFRQAESSSDLLALVRVEVPEWFEPLSRRLAINDIRWHDVRNPPNHIEDFDPWSQLVLSRVQTLL